MPGLFRIIPSSRSSGSSNSSGPNSSSSNNPAAQPSRTSRSTYPGQRAMAANPSTGVQSSSFTSSAPSGLPTTTPRTGSLSSSTPSSMMNSQAQQRQYTTSAAPPAQANSTSGASDPPSTSNGPPANTVIRGSSVAPGTRAPPPSTPVPTNAPANRPGAYQISRTSNGPSQVYRVTVPRGVRPGAEFTVHAGPRRVRVRCPPTSQPGQSLQITLPPEPVTHQFQLRMAPLTAAGVVGEDNQPAGGGAVPMTPEVQRVNEQARESGGTAQSFLVTIPPNIYPGMQFNVSVAGQRFMVTCPPKAGPNMRVRIVPPTMPSEPEVAPQTQVFEVAVPQGVIPGQPFALIANGQRVLVTCPPNVRPGQKIRFSLPVSQVVGNIQLQYESQQGGWSRTVRVSDLKFQWVRLDASDANEDGENKVNTDETFDFQRSAYVRKITFLEGNDARMRSGYIDLVPASEAVVDSRLVVHQTTIMTYGDIASAQGKSMDEKIEWFQGVCNKLTPAYEDGRIKILVRRKYLLMDSVEAIMSLGRDDLRKRWHIEFMGEEAIDAGGVRREWFQLVTENIFDPSFGLWMPSANNQMCVNINPASSVSCPDDYLIYFRFLGRVLGRALFDRQLVKGHMVRTIYKHLLGWPVTFEDIQAQDEDYYKNLKKLTDMNPDDIANMFLDFTVTEESMGVREDVPLVEGGSEKEVTGENLGEYLECNLKYRLMGRTKLQLTELLLGFFDIIPEPALVVFDANELELILCGLPTIDMQDWRENTNYSGLVSSSDAKVIDMFWDVVENDFDRELRARLLQFVTGTSGVPARGFSVLQGSDGNIKKFTIHVVDKETFAYPRSHTCFNRIDLPNYTSRQELHDKLKTAITLCSVGFSME